MSLIYPKLDGFLESLQLYRSEIDTFNPWSDYDLDYDATSNAPLIRVTQLKGYLACRILQAKCILVAEAVGYQGGKFSGMPMTSERILLGKQKGIPVDIVLPGSSASRTSSRDKASSKTVKEQGYAEPMATIVWKHLQECPLSPLEVILWNAFPFHPFRLEQGCLSNRTPRENELKLGLGFLEKLTAVDCPLPTSSADHCRW